MRRFAFQAAAALALVSSGQLLAAQTQAAQAEACMTRPELRGMVAYFLPTVLQSTIDTCTSRLAPDSYLLGRAPRLVESLEVDRSEAWPMAKKAILKMGDDRNKGTTELLANLPEEAVGPLINAIITKELSSEIKPENCADINRVMAPLEPLPAANMVDLVIEALSLAGRSEKKMRVCKEV
jgi:hypothetical protein